jgi:hypothetical protein
MKHLSVYILSFVIVIINAQFGFQIAIYEVFKPSIIEQFCINKDVVDRDCEAMCFMKDNVLDEGKAQKDPASTEHQITIKLVEADLRDLQIRLPEVFGTDVKINYPISHAGLLDLALQTPHAPPQV